MSQFKLHNIHISDQAQFAMIDIPLKWHLIDICKNKLQKVDLLTHLDPYWS
jgi:hypothetical protein